MQKLTCPLAKVKFHASISYLETFLPLLKSSEIREIHNSTIFSTLFTNPKSADRKLARFFQKVNKLSLVAMTLTFPKQNQSLEFRNLQRLEDRSQTKTFSDLLSHISQKRSDQMSEKSGDCWHIFP